ncbi:MAG: hypothetical protein N2691_03965 [Patescibacteria group bacterium]|nr:hypothetical protein [Patescibacteria group bacterium]
MAYELFVLEFENEHGEKSLFAQVEDANGTENEDISLFLEQISEPSAHDFVIQVIDDVLRGELEANRIEMSGFLCVVGPKHSVITDMTLEDPYDVTIATEELRDLIEIWWDEYTDFVLKHKAN